MRTDFKGNFDLEGFEAVLKKVARISTSIVATITSNSAGGQPVYWPTVLTVTPRNTIFGDHGSARFEKRLFRQAVKQNTKTDHRADHPRNLQYADKE